MTSYQRGIFLSGFFRSGASFDESPGERKSSPMRQFLVGCWEPRLARRYGRCSGGLLTGLSLSPALARLLASLIGEINALDRGTLAGVSAVLLLLLASWLPASRMYPWIFVRCE